MAKYRTNTLQRPSTPTTAKHLWLESIDHRLANTYPEFLAAAGMAPAPRKSGQSAEEDIITSRCIDRGGEDSRASRLLKNRSIPPATPAVRYSSDVTYARVACRCQNATFHDTDVSTVATPLTYEIKRNSIRIGDILISHFDMSLCSL